MGRAQTVFEQLSHLPVRDEPDEDLDEGGDLLARPDGTLVALDEVEDEDEEEDEDERTVIGRGSESTWD